MSTSLVEAALAASRAAEAKRKAESEEAHARARRLVRQQLNRMLPGDHPTRDGPHGSVIVIDRQTELEFSLFHNSLTELQVRLVSRPEGYRWHPLVGATEDVFMRKLGNYLDNNIEWLLLERPRVEIDVDEDGDAMCPHCGCVGHLRCTVREYDYDTAFTVKDNVPEYETDQSGGSDIVLFHCPKCGWSVDPNEVDIEWLPWPEEEV
jgi:hypothetical protein